MSTSHSNDALLIPDVSAETAARLLGGFGAARPVATAQSLQARITAAVLVTVVVVLAVGCSLFMLEQRRTERLEASRVAQSFTDMVAAVDAPRLVGPGADLPAGQIAAMSRLKRLQSLTAVDAKGVQRFAYRQPGVSNAPVTLYRAPAFVDGRRVGEVTVAVLPPGVGQASGEYLAMGGALFFAATGLALFMGRWLAARITTPVARLSAAMDAIGASGEMAVRVVPDSHDEIGRLTMRFNELMDRLHLKDQALRRTMGELVEARDAAEAANLAKSQFLANMSHEIRTPLNGVLAMAQVLEQGVAEPAQRDQARVIRQSGEILLGLLNDMLDVSKIEAGRLELEEVEFDLESTARGALAGFAELAAAKGLTLDVTIEATARGQRRGDRVRLRQVISNFVSNALKFTEVGGVSVSFAGEGDDGAEGVRFAVSDTGIGIPAEKLAMVFQRFVQVDSSTTRRFGGTGLGLTICEELSALMGGQVWVESEPGRGSTFYASLPLVRTGPATAPAPRAEAIVAGARDALPTGMSPLAESGVVEAGVPESGVAEPGADPIRVLAAEDNATNQLVLTTIMQIFGFELTIAGDGRQAVELWRGGAFDVVLMDIQMPVMDGVAATRAIRSFEASEGRPRTPILALSANALPQQVETYYAAGMDGHVAKPIELARLQTALEEVLLGETAERGALAATA
jgi:signal transduction histidine kinase/AmiR/NasT family two-component response regulator